MISNLYSMMFRFLSTIFLLLCSIGASSQNFAFIGENSYPSTEKYTLASNSDKEDIGDLNIVFAKNLQTALIIVSAKLSGAVKIANKLILYLDDGKVISCADRGINDNVDEIAVSAFYLTSEEVAALKNSNLNAIRYEIVCPVCGAYNYWEGVYSASNTGSSKTDFTEVVEQFFEE